MKSLGSIWVPSPGTTRMLSPRPALDVGQIVLHYCRHHRGRGSSDGGGHTGEIMASLSHRRLIVCQLQLRKLFKNAITYTDLLGSLVQHQGIDVFVYQVHCCLCFTFFCQTTERLHRSLHSGRIDPEEKPSTAMFVGRTLGPMCF